MFKSSLPLSPSSEVVLASVQDDGAIPHEVAHTDRSLEHLRPCAVAAILGQPRCPVRAADAVAAANVEPALPLWLAVADLGPEPADRLPSRRCHAPPTAVGPTAAGEVPAGQPQHRGGALRSALARAERSAR